MDSLLAKVVEQSPGIGGMLVMLVIFRGVVRDITDKFEAKLTALEMVIGKQNRAILSLARRIKEMRRDQDKDEDQPRVE